MIALPDVDVLVALFDPSHVHHDAAHEWFGTHRGSGWATCPITENAFVRVVSHPEYPGRRATADDAIERLCAFTEGDDAHHFWPDSTSLRRRSRLRPGALAGHEAVQGAYLLLLTVEHEGRLVTFDDQIPLTAVPQARTDQVVVLGR